MVASTNVNPNQDSDKPIPEAKSGIPADSLSLLHRDLEVTSTPQLNFAHEVVNHRIQSQPLTAGHCVTIFFPSLAGDTDKLADDEDFCSLIERHGFALVLLACCITLAIGESGRLRVVACDLLTEAIVLVWNTKNLKQGLNYSGSVM